MFLGYNEKSKIYKLMNKSNKKIINFGDVFINESLINKSQHVNIPIEHLSALDVALLKDWLNQCFKQLKGGGCSID